MFERGQRVQSKEGGAYYLETGTITHLHSDEMGDGDITHNTIGGQSGEFWVSWDNPTLPWANCWMHERLLKPFPERGDRVRYCAEVQPEHDRLHGLVGTVKHLHGGDEGYDEEDDGTVWVEWDENDQYPWPGFWCPVDLLRKA